MKIFSSLCALGPLLPLAASTILQNGQVRQTNFLNTKTASISSNSSAWKTYAPNAPELSYKGRWDSKHVSWWAAPGLKFGFEGQDVAITFGEHTTPGVLIAYRVSGMDWQMTNVTVGATHHLISASTPGVSGAQSWQLPFTFELRVTNWAYGVQISAVHLSSSSKLIKIPNFAKKIEFIGDSLTSGMYATYEAFSGFGYNIGAGFGNVEFSITAYPGICLHDADCWGNPRGQTYQWLQTSDTSWRASQLYGKDPEPWNFSKDQPADIVLINLGTNDNNTANYNDPAAYYTSYIKLVSSIHETYPDAQIILMSLWNGFYGLGNSYYQSAAFVNEIQNVYKHFEKEGYVHYFDSTGILQHNDIGPQWHPTDVGHIKVASHVMQYIKMKFGWTLGATGPEVQHETLYWNDEQGY
ncbi:acetylxylan esterase [Amniculicola lignicola CBS 123094]|uniref:Acetylxylan esterase n=1 Tax=Amniculicola lignicola CBS 123094 TaxID=1392246 RepID=A0A6A5W7U0_9PLEO|nr:acetylxylan esterase [Amniculicola lignicola CBS 123094]